MSRLRNELSNLVFSTLFQREECGAGGLTVGTATLSRRIASFAFAASRRVALTCTKPPMPPMPPGPYIAGAKWITSPNAVAMAPRTRFTDAEEAWIQAQMNEYIEKFKNTSRNADDTLWKSAKWSLFCEKFGSVLDEGETSAEVWKKRFFRKYTNAKNRAPTKSATSSLPPPTIVVPQDVTVDSARDLFIAEHKDEINDEVNKERQEKHLDHHAHVGMYQAATKQRWDSLHADERAVWVERAEALQNAEERWDDEQLRRNQQNIMNILSATFRGMIGPGPRWLGKVAFHLLYGYRDVDDIAQSGCITIGQDSEVSRFDQMAPNYQENVKDIWLKWCEENIPRDIGSRSAMKRDKNNMPILPDFNDEAVTLSEMRSTLKAFLEAVWYLIWPKSSDMELPPWDDIKAHPTDYLKSPLPGSLALSDPSSMDLSGILQLIEHIKTTQCNTPEVCAVQFRCKEDIDAAIRARTEADSDEEVLSTPLVRIQRAARRVVSDDDNDETPIPKPRSHTTSHDNIVPEVAITDSNTSAIVNGITTSREPIACNDALPGDAVNGSATDDAETSTERPPTAAKTCSADHADADIEATVAAKDTVKPKKKGRQAKQATVASTTPQIAPSKRKELRLQPKTQAIAVMALEAAAAALQRGTGLRRRATAVLVVNKFVTKCRS
ncbi:hypothetical protein BD410DRAFT_846159 [Rickenella mellea]|uniref:Uncharacterized protein n=1 Tax=Rickenella mellea TaxID=50990 RepID=A0A4Y7PFU6_9AGAM|nr:hypothetical protein BD410DRAFT_846159 [Rickenella mellea]